MNRTRRRPQQRIGTGFTLMELLIVLVIIGLLASFVGPRYFGQLSKSEVKTARAQLVALEKALDHYRLDVGHYPSTEQGLVALNSRPGNEARWDGPYLDGDIPADPWGYAFVYTAPGVDRDYDLISLGRDGRPGGTELDTDLRAR